MKYRLLVIGKATSWVDEGVSEYAKRIPNFSVERVPNNPSKTRMRRMLSACGEGSFRVYLDKSGRALSSEDLATFCTSRERQGNDVCLRIGDDGGFNAADLAQANLVWSLSTLTFPHQLTRIVVCEQLYRAYSINAGHAYHRS